MKQTLMHQRPLLMTAAIVCALTMQGGHAQAQSAPRSAGEAAITAIDILLRPDAAMLKHAAANNARLLGVFPKGFALDAAHTRNSRNGI